MPWYRAKCSEIGGWLQQGRREMLTSRLKKKVLTLRGPEMRGMAYVVLTEEFSFPEKVTRHISVQCMSLPASSCCHRKTFFFFTLIHWTSTYGHTPVQSIPWLSSGSQTNSPGLLDFERRRGERELENVLALVLPANSWTPSARWLVGTWPLGRGWILFLPCCILAGKLWSS